MPSVLTVSACLFTGCAQFEAESGGALSSGARQASLLARLLLLLLVLAYVAFAWQIASVRQWLGLPSAAGGDGVATIDSINRGIASVLLAFTGWVALSGTWV